MLFAGIIPVASVIVLDDVGLVKYLSNLITGVLSFLPLSPTAKLQEPFALAALTSFGYGRSPQASRFGNVAGYLLSKSGIVQPLDKYMPTLPVKKSVAPIP